MPDSDQERPGQLMAEHLRYDEQDTNPKPEKPVWPGDNATDAEKAEYDKLRRMYDNELIPAWEARDEAIKAKYPNVEDTDWVTVGKKLWKGVSMYQDPGMLNQQIPVSEFAAEAGIEDYYRHYNPEEMAAQAYQNAKNIAYANNEDIKPDMRDKPVYPGDGATRAQFDAYNAAKDAFDAAWEVYNGNVDNDLNALLSDEIIRSALVAGHEVDPDLLAQAMAADDRELGTPTGPLTTGTIGVDKAAVTADAIAKAAGLQEQEREAEYASKYGGKAGKGNEWSAYWDAYHALENTDQKRQFLLANPEFAAYYQANYVDEGETPWWTVPYTSSQQYYSTWRGGGGWSGGGGGGWSSPEKPKYIDRGTPAQAYMFPIRQYESPRYPTEWAQYRAPQQEMSLAQLRALIGAGNYRPRYTG